MCFHENELEEPKKKKKDWLFCKKTEHTSHPPPFFFSLSLSFSLSVSVSLSSREELNTCVAISYNLILGVLFGGKRIFVGCARWCPFRIVQDTPGKDKCLWIFIDQSHTVRNDTLHTIRAVLRVGNNCSRIRHRNDLLAPYSRMLVEIKGLNFMFFVYASGLCLTVHALCEKVFYVPMYGGWIMFCSIMLAIWRLL